MRRSRQAAHPLHEHGTGHDASELPRSTKEFVRSYHQLRTAAVASSFALALGAVVAALGRQDDVHDLGEVNAGALREGVERRHAVAVEVVPGRRGKFTIATANTADAVSSPSFFGCRT